MIRVDLALRPADLEAAVERHLGALGREDPRRSKDAWNASDGAPVFTLARPLHGARLDRLDTGVPVRLRHPAVRRHRRAALPRARTRAHLRADGAARHAHGRPRPRLQQREHLGRAAAARARGPLRAGRAASASCASWRSRPAAPSRRGAGRARPTAAASSTRSTARTRCSPTPCARCARWRSRTSSATRCSTRATGRCRCSSGWCCTRARRPASPCSRARGRDIWDERGRVAHESLFDRVDGSYRCPATQQGYSPFTHLDAGPGVGAARLRGAARVPGDGRRRGARALGGRGGRRRVHARGGARDRGPLPRSTRRSTASRTGTPARPGSRGSAATGSGRPTRSTTTSRSTPRPRRSPRRACCASAVCSSGAATAEDGRVLRPGGADGHPHAARRRPYLSEDPQSPGPAAALGLPPPERLGLRAARAQGAAAASPRSGATTTCASWRCSCSGSRDGAAVLHVLRPAGRRHGERPRRPRHGRRRAASVSASRAASRRTASTCCCAARARSPPTSEERWPHCARPGARSPTCRRTSRGREDRARLDRGGAGALRPARRARQQRRRRARGAGRPARGGRGELRPSCCAINLKGPYFLTQLVARCHARAAPRRPGLAAAASCSSPRSRPRVSRPTAATTA